MVAAAILSLAIVTQNQLSLRAAPHDNAQQQAVLSQGDALEIRGKRLDYLQVYDHRHERAGYVRASAVRTVSTAPSQAPELLAVVRFVQDTPGLEALGIAYSAAYLKAAPAADIRPDIFDAMGAMAERLASRASQRAGSDSTVAAHLEVVAQYGVRMLNYQSASAVQICYDGEAFRQLLASPKAEPEMQARAALGLTRHRCIDPTLSPMAHYQWDQWRGKVLDAVDTSKLPAVLQNRVQLRRAGVWSALAFQEARRGELLQSQLAGQRALNALAAVNKIELTDEDQSDYADAAVRTGASRWAAEPGSAGGVTAKVQLQTRPGQPGETCVLLTDATHGLTKPLFQQCTYSQVWPASVSVNRAGNAVVLATQPLVGWREIWLLRQKAGQWGVDVLPAGEAEPELGYVEFAGWVPAKDQLLLAREYKDKGRIQRSFDVLNVATMEVEKRAANASGLHAFQQWQDPLWKRLTVSLR